MNADALRGKMAERRYTQARLAQEIGISAQSLSRKLTGKREFRLNEVLAICRCLNIDDPANIFLPQSSQIRND
jgi:transcriptional regulator with XRE-family HTH domain